MKKIYQGNEQSQNLLMFASQGQLYQIARLGRNRKPSHGVFGASLSRYELFLMALTLLSLAAHPIQARARFYLRRLSYQLSKHRRLL